MIDRILCSTGAFSRDPDLTDPKNIVKGMNDLQCDGFELIFYPSFYEDTNSVRQTFSPLQDQIHVLHTEKSIGPLLGTGNKGDANLALQRLEENASLASTLQIDRLVLHLWGLPDSDQYIDRNFSYFENCYEIATSYNCQLNIESIPCLKSSPARLLRYLATQHNQALFTLDTEFLAMHRELSSALADDLLLDRTRHLHVKDYDGALVDGLGKRVYKHPGQGNIDFYNVLSRIHNAPNAIDVCLESTSVNATGIVEIEQVQRDLEFIKEIMVSVQRHSI